MFLSHLLETHPILKKMVSSILNEFAAYQHIRVSLHLNSVFTVYTTVLN